MVARHFSGNVPLSRQEGDLAERGPYVGRHFASDVRGHGSVTHGPEGDAVGGDIAPDRDGQKGSDWAKEQVEAMYLELSAQFGTERAGDAASEVPHGGLSGEADAPPSQVDAAAVGVDGRDGDPSAEATRELDPEAIQARLARGAGAEQVLGRERRERLEVGEYAPSASASLGMAARPARKRPFVLFAAIGERVARMLRLDER